MGYLEKFDAERRAAQRVGQLQQQRDEQMRQSVTPPSLQEQIEIAKRLDERGIGPDNRVKDIDSLVVLLKQLKDGGYMYYFSAVARKTKHDLDFKYYMRDPEINHSAGTTEAMYLLILKAWGTQLGFINDRNGPGSQSFVKDHTFNGTPIKTSEMFSGDSRMTGLIEQEGVSFGIRLTKNEDHISGISGFKESLGIEHDVTEHTRTEAVFVRLYPSGDAIVTGRQQFHEPFTDLKGFDDVLEIAINDPAVFHNSRIVRWSRPTPEPSTHNEGHS